MRRAAQIAALIAVAIAAPALGNGGHSGSHSSSHSGMHSSSGSHHGSKPSGSHSMSGHHHKHGNTKGGSHATNEFMSSHPCPSTGKPSRPCPGYEISDGGSGDPSTMQWQAVQVPL